MRLELLPAEFGVARLPAPDEVPVWAHDGAFCSITRSERELSIVCEAASIPRQCRQHSGFRCLRVAGTLAFEQTGVLLALTAPLTQAGVSILAIGTYDTDYLLVPAAALEQAVGALRAAGHDVTSMD